MLSTMVRFRRFRIRSPLPSAPSSEEEGDDALCLTSEVDADTPVTMSQDLLIPNSTKTTTTNLSSGSEANNTTPSHNNSTTALSRRGSSLKELEHKERQFTEEEKKLQSLLQQVEDDADNHKDESLEQSLDNTMSLTKTNKQRTNSTGSISLSTADSTSVSLTRSETAQTIPLWKRKLSRIQEKSAPKVDSSFEAADRSASPVIVETPVELETSRTAYSIRQAMTEEMAPVEEDAILDAPVGLPRGTSC